LSGRPFVITADEAWELAGWLNEIYAQYVGLDPPVGWEGVDAADAIEVVSFPRQIALSIACASVVL
jgi:hypothetical protein